MHYKYPAEIFNNSKKLKEFLALTEDEEELKNELERLLGLGVHSIDSVQARIINPSVDMVSLIKIAEHSPVFFDALHHEKFQSFWKEVWRIMGRKDTFHMLPQPPIQNLTLFLGYFYYQEAIHRICEKQKYTPKEMEFLKKAESYHSFHALNELNKHDLAELKTFARTQKLYPDQSLRTILNRALTAALYHGTPGYLITAETCYSIAQYHAALGHKEAITSSLILSLHYLVLAENHLKDSQASINNAYFGKGLKASNWFGLETISDIKALVIEYSGKYLTSDNIKFAEQMESPSLPINFQNSNRLTPYTHCS